MGSRVVGGCLGLRCERIQLGESWDDKGVWMDSGRKGQDISARRGPGVRGCCGMDICWMT
jgi:hypothetical protein